MTSATDIAWAAGLFEGEGCISLEGERRAQGFRQLQLAVTSTDRDVLERYAEVVGGASLYEQKSTGPKVAWRMVMRGDAAVRVLQMFLPYLGQRRYAKALEAIAERERQIEVSTTSRICRSCGETFRPAWGRNASRQVHCSDSCRTTHRIRRKAAT